MPLARTRTAPRLRRLLVCLTLVAASTTFLSAASSVASSEGPASVAARSQVAARPQITGISTSRGPATGGTGVVIRGRNFAAVRSVLFGSVAATRATVRSASVVEVIAPDHAPGRVDIRVVTRAGTSPVVAADRFVFTGWAAQRLPLPPDATGSSRLAVAGRPPVLACGARACVAAGIYSTGGFDQVVLWHRSGSAWSARRAPLPADASTDPRLLLDTAACGGTTCVLAGRYSRHAGGADDRTAVLWTLTVGSEPTWTAVSTPLPTAARAGSVTLVRQVACGSSRCVAAGGYAPFSSATAFASAIWSFDGRAWTSDDLPLPADANPADLATYLAHEQVACARTDLCAVQGEYRDSRGLQLGALWTLSDGGWRVAKQRVPSGRDLIVDPRRRLDGSLSCGDGGVCVAQRESVDFSGQYRHDLVWRWVAEQWSVIALPQPVDVATDPTVHLDVTDCGGSVCAAAGHYTDRGGDVRGALWTITATDARVAPAPQPLDAAQNPTYLFTAITCGSADTCLAQAKVATTSGSSRQLYRLSAAQWGLEVAPWASAAPLRVAGATCSVIACIDATGRYSSIWLRGGGGWSEDRGRAPFDAASTSGQPLGVACSPTQSCAVIGRYVRAGTTAPEAWTFVP